MRESIDRVLAALEDIKAGKMVILVDDEDRENEGDLVMAAELVTAESINFMVRFARGLVCLPLTQERIEELELPMMVDDNRSSRSTAFTISIEARSGVTTGISAADRAHTIKTAVSPEARPGDLVSPGHVFPLKAKPGGVLQRTGHTEGAVDLARLAGLAPAGVICEIMNDDGTMARFGDLEVFAKQHGLRILSIADMIEYRLSREQMVAKVRSSPVTLPSGREWTAHVYEVGVGDRRHFVALTLGDIGADPTLVRVHTGSLFGDVFGVRMGRRLHLPDAVARIEAEGRGVVLVVPWQPDADSDLAFYLGEPIPVPLQDQGEVLREYGLGAQVLADLGLRKIRTMTNRPRRIPSLEGYHLEIVEQILVPESTSAEIADETKSAGNGKHDGKVRG